MTLTYTIQRELGSKAPNFRLLDVVSGKHISFSDIRGPQGTVVLFICNHCPYVIHMRSALLKVAREYLDKGLGFVAISSNFIGTHPQDGPEQMKALAESDGFPFPYLYDEDQEVAKAYEAACTPDLFVYDQDDKCVYRGRFDSSSPGKPDSVTGADLRVALDALIEGKGPLSEQVPSMGCNIKWKPGKEPTYYG